MVTFGEIARTIVEVVMSYYNELSWHSAVGFEETNPRYLS
jgi:hypothetical protein